MASPNLLPRDSLWEYPDLSKTYTTINPLNMTDYQAEKQAYAQWLASRPGGVSGNPIQSFPEYYQQMFGTAQLPGVASLTAPSRGAYTNTASQPTNVDRIFDKSYSALKAAGADQPSDVMATYEELKRMIGSGPDLNKPVPGPFDVSGMRARGEGIMNDNLTKFVMPKILESMGMRGMRYSTSANQAVADAAAKQMMDMEKLYAPLEAQAYEEYAGREMTSRAQAIQLYGEYNELAQTALAYKTQAEIAAKNNQFALATEYAKQAVAAENAAQDRMVRLTEINAQLEGVDRNNQAQAHIAGINNDARLRESMMKTGAEMYSRYNISPGEYGQLVDRYLNTNPIFAQVVQSSPVYRREQTAFDTMQNFNKMLASGMSLGQSLFGDGSGRTSAIGLLAQAGQIGIKTVGDFYNWITGAPLGSNPISYAPGAAGESYADIFPGVDPSTTIPYSELIGAASEYGDVPLDMFGGAF